MGFVLLFLIEIAFILINIELLKRDILSPSTITSLGMFAATFLAYTEVELWNIEINWLTIIVMFFGLLTATLSEGLLDKKIRFSSLGNFDAHQLKNDYHFNKKIYKYFVIISFLLFCLYVVDAYRVGISNGGTGLNAFAYMKNAYMTSNGNKMNSIIRQGYKIVMAMAYISSFFLVNNIILHKTRMKYNITFIISIILGLLITIASGSRTEILRIIFAILLDFSILWRESKHWPQNINKRSNKFIIKKAIPLVVIVILFAFLSKTVVKTADVELSATHSVIYYVAYYVGSSIAVLNNKLSVGFSNSNILLPAQNSVSSFVYLGALNYGGNVSTLLGNKVLESGLIGMIVYLVFIYSIFGYFYKHYLMNSYSSYRRNRVVIVYSMVYYVVSMSYYSDCFFELTSGITDLLTVIIVLVLYKIFTKRRRPAYES